MKLLDLPPEILIDIRDHLDQVSHLQNLVRTCKTWYSLAEKRLYELDVESDEGRCLEWATEYPVRLDTIRRAIALEVDILQPSHLELLAILPEAVDIMQGLFLQERFTNELQSASAKTLLVTLLRRAVYSWSDDPAMVRFLLENGAPPDGGPPQYGHTLLQHAVDSDSHGKATALIEYGADCQDLLSRVARRGNAEILKMVLARISEDEWVQSFDDAMFWASSAKSSECLRLLCDANKDNERFCRIAHRLIHQAAWAGSINAFMLLLERGATIQGSDGNPCTELLHESSNVEITRFLVEKGIPVDVLSKFRETPLLAAASIGNTDIVRFLLSAGADPDALRHQKAEIQVMDDASIRYQKSLCTQVRGPVPEDCELTPLHYAASRNDRLIIRSLLEYGADPYIMKGIRRPLDFAALSIRFSLQIMVDAGVNINTVRDDGDTALHLVARGSGRHTAALLRQLGSLNVALDARNAEGDTALHLVARDQTHQTLSTFLEFQPSLNITNDQGWTPLMVGCHRNKNKVSMALLNAGANAHCTVAGEPGGETALQIALRVRASKSILVELLKAGAHANNCEGLSQQQMKRLKSGVAIKSYYETKNTGKVLKQQS